MVLLLRNPIYTQLIIINMRKITQEAIRALLDKREFKKGNTQVKAYDAFGHKNAYLFLHGNIIARYIHNDDLIITAAGWKTNTTKERLNGLPNVHIQQKNFEWFLNGELWDGKPVKI